MSLGKGNFFLPEPVGKCVLSFIHISRLWMNVIPLAIMPDWDCLCSEWQHVLLFLFHWIPCSYLCLAHVRPLKIDSLNPCTPARWFWYLYKIWLRGTFKKSQVCWSVFLTILKYIICFLFTIFTKTTFQTIHFVDIWLSPIILLYLLYTRVPQREII